MFLKSVNVENYRAVKKAGISFDDTTVLIGENESGKSSLLHVLKKVFDSERKLGALVFKPHHFHRSNNIAGSIVIKCCFEEQTPNEWDDDKFFPIADIFKSKDNDKRQLILEITATPSNDDEVRGNWSVYSEGSSPLINDEKTFLWIQGVNPVINLSAGMLTGHGVEHLPEFKPIPTDFDEPDEIRNAIEVIESSSNLLIKGHSLNNRETIEKGYQAARKFITHYARKSDDENRPQLAKRINDILGNTHSRDNGNVSTLFENQEGTAQKLGILLMIAALLRTSILNTNYDIDPIWIIEDPEAHLHPMTISSVALLVEVIRWQKIITTYSSELLGKVPLSHIRRLKRFDGVITEYKVRKNSLNSDDLRKISYHLRAYNNEAFFARVWLFVEGESEYWIVPQIAQYMGCNFSLEGINCIVFAQSGLAPLIKVAREFGIDWYILADGDEAGHGYLRTAKKFTKYDEQDQHITMLQDRDIEHCFWNNGYANFYVDHARLQKRNQNVKPNWVIKRAVKYHSKPFLSLKIMESVFAENSPGVPKKLEEVVKNCISLARKNNKD